MVAQLTAGMRNNNPGNIKYAPSINWQGQVGPSQNTDQGDPQVVFNSQAAGMRALARNIATKYNGGATTIQQLIAGPGGWTPGYQPGANGVAAAAGLPVDQPIDMSNPSVLAQVMRGIVTQEHGPASSLYTDQMITDGISAATGNPVPPMNVPAVGSDYANTSLPIPMAPRSDTAQQAVTNPDGSVNWGAFYQGLAAPAQLATGPTASPVGGDFAALGMQGQNPSLAAALAGYAAPSAPITDAASAADFYSGFGLGPASAQSATPSMTLGDQLAFNPINVPDSTLAMGSPNANYGDALTNNTSFAAYPQGATVDSGAVPLSNFLASIGAAPTVGAPPVTTPVHSVAIGANGQPVTAGTPAASQGLTEAQQLAMLALPAAGGINTAANPGAGYDSLYGQGSAPGAQYTGQGIAGTAQLPSGVVPPGAAAAAAQAVAAMGGAGGASSPNNASWAELQRSFGGMTPEQAAALNSQTDAIANPLPSGGGNPGAPPLTQAQVDVRDANMSWQLAAFSPQSNGNSDSNDASQSWTNLINSFDNSVPYAVGSVNDTKDQSQLSQDSGLSFAGPAITTTAPTTRQVISQQLNPAYQAWVDNQNSAIYGVEGVPSPSLDASGNVVLPSSYLGAAPAATAAPAKYIPITKTITVPGKTIAAAPALGIAAAPVVQAPIAAPNGYLYAPNPAGGYTQVGQSAQYAGMTPSQQYAAAAAPALASQTNLGGGGGNHDSQNRAGGGLTG